MKPSCYYDFYWPSNRLSPLSTLPFHDPFLLCNLSFHLSINLNLSCCDHFIFPFLPTIRTLHMYPFSSLCLFIGFTHVSISLTPSFVCVSVYSKSSSAFNSLCLSRFSYFLSMHLCCVFLFFSFSNKACKCVSVGTSRHGINYEWAARIHCESTNYGGKFLSNCALKTIKSSMQCNCQETTINIRLCTGHTLKCEI